MIGASGGVGSFTVQIAKAMGAEVTGVCSTLTVEMVRALGADRVIDYRHDDFTAHDNRYDVIVDIAGHRRLSDLRRCLVADGTLVIVGSETGGRRLGGFALEGTGDPTAHVRDGRTRGKVVITV